MDIQFWAAIASIISAVIAAFTFYFGIEQNRDQLSEEVKQKEKYTLIIPKHVIKRKQYRSKRRIVLFLATISV